VTPTEKIAENDGFHQTKRFRQAQCTMLILRETVLVVSMVDSYKPGHYDVRGSGDAAPHILSSHGDRREFQSPNPVALYTSYCTQWKTGWVISRPGPKQQGRL
jgi:hypothetical protein